MPNLDDLDITAIDEDSFEKFKKAIFAMVAPINIRDAVEKIATLPTVEERRKQVKKVKRKVEIHLLVSEPTPKHILDMYQNSKNPQPIAPVINKNQKMIKLADGTIVPKKKGPMPKGAVLLEPIK